MLAVSENWCVGRKGASGTDQRVSWEKTQTVGESPATSAFMLLFAELVTFYFPGISDKRLEIGRGTHWVKGKAWDGKALCSSQGL